MATTEAGYLLRSELAEVDIDRFDALIDDGLAQLDRGEHRPALHALDDALGLLRGQPLPEFTDAEFARPHIDRVDQRHRVAVEGRLEARLALGSHRQVVTEARQLLHDDPYNEAIWAVLMTALHRSHHRTEALRTYRIAAAQLAEAGLEPTRRLSELEARILDDDPSLTPSPPPPLHNLPDPGTGTIGGATVGPPDAADDLRRHRHVTLIGPTIAARQAAVDLGHTLLPEFPDGVWLIEPADATDEDSLAHSLLDALGVLGGPDPRRALTDRLTGQTLLFVTIDVDGTRPSLTWLRSLIDATAPGSRLLTTSERPAGTDGPIHAVGAPGGLRPAQAEPTAPTTIRAGAGEPAGPDLSPEALFRRRLSVFAGPVPPSAIKEVVGTDPLTPNDVDYLIGRLAALGHVVADNTLPVTRFAAAAPDRLSIEGASIEIQRRHTAHYLELAGRLIDDIDGPDRRNLLLAAAAEHLELRAAIDREVTAGRVDQALRIGRGAGTYWSREGYHLGMAVTTLSGLASLAPEPSPDAAGVQLVLGFAWFRSGAYRPAASAYDRSVTMARELAADDLLGRALVERAHLEMFLGRHDRASDDLAAADRLPDGAATPARRARTAMLRAQLAMRSNGPGAPATGGDRPETLLDEAIGVFQRLGHTGSEANARLVKASRHIDLGQPGEALDQARRAVEITQLGDDRSMLAFGLARAAEAWTESGQAMEALDDALEAIRISVQAGNWLVASLALLAIGSVGEDVPLDERRRCVEGFRAIRRHLGVPTTTGEERRMLAVDPDAPPSPPMTFADAEALAHRIAADAVGAGIRL